MFVCVAQFARSIIVKDPPTSGNEYNYSYNIEDPTTGDTKSQHEVRQGNVVSGVYSVLAADGTGRIVHYTADPKHDFKAVVTQEPVEAVLLVRQHSVHLSQEISADNNGFSDPYDSALQDAMDTSLFAQVSLLDIQYPLLTYFTPVNKLKKNKRIENGQYFTPNSYYIYPPN